MKRGTVILLLLVVAVIVVYGLLAHDAMHAPVALNTVTEQKTVDFESRQLLVPDAWNVYGFATREGLLTLTHKSGSGLDSMLTLEDERAHPVLASQFVSGWLRSRSTSGLNALDLGPFHDRIVDTAAAPCVEMHYNGPRPLKVICVSSDGKWQLSLSGSDDDIAALDTIAGQLPSFTRGR